MDAWAKSEMAAPGLGYIILETGDDGPVGRGPIANNLEPEEVSAIARAAGLDGGDVVFFAVGPRTEAERLAGAARTRIGQELGLIEAGAFRFCWIVDFPMYERNEETGHIEFSHNPFSMPQGGLETLERADPLTIKAFQYDIVCNGVELSSGAIRNHHPEVMLKAFEIAGHGRNETEVKFAGMLNAFRYGAPPHGGTAPGIDRIVMLIAGEENLREITLFPMNQQAQDLMMNAPGEVLPKQLRELHIRVVQPEKS